MQPELFEPLNALTRALDAAAFFLNVGTCALAAIALFTFISALCNAAIVSALIRNREPEGVNEQISP